MFSKREVLISLLMAAGLGCGSEPGAGAGSGPDSMLAGRGTDNGDPADNPFGNSDVMAPAPIGMPVEPRPEPDEADGECGAVTLQAEQVMVEEMVEVESVVTETLPAAIYVMLDQSRSMVNNNLWVPATNAVSQFVNDPASAGFDVALQYFPISGGVCADGGGYKTPAVAVGRLPEHAEQIDDSLDNANPAGGGGTPIEGALRGVTEFCKQFQTDHADEACVAVLVTDGLPQNSSGCSENDNVLAGIAGAAFMAGVTTFAVGLDGADFSLLDQIAMQGGAPDCDPGPGYACDVSGGASQLSNVLATIRDTVTRVETHTEVVTHTEQRILDCEWALPAPPSGEQFDRNKVNVKMTAPGVDQALGRVDSPSACAAGGWHYDNPSAPARIIVCPQSCDAIRETPDARIDVLLGCATELLVE